jgi:hypothetical protein
MNRLSSEPSLYLRQHAENPVNWITLRDRPFEIAKKEDKPVFISIGYSSCHWCHVMSREAFNDKKIADFLNKNFIPVKVDREEYPDIDKKYQFYIQILGKNGGWPLSVFADTDGVPFFAGTYFPPNEKYGIPGFMDVLEQIVDFYTNNKKKLLKIKEGYFNILNEHQKIDPSKEIPREEFKKSILKIIDSENGGLKGINKFPNIPMLQALTDSFFLNDENIKKFLDKTAIKLCTSGIYDHINGGFFRYCVNEQWSFPHFEKMLYDNALNVSFLCRMYDITDNKLFKYTAEKTLDFLMEEFFTEHGFISSMNAESIDFMGEMSEGFYYKVFENDFEVLSEKEIHLISNKIFLKENFINLGTENYEEVIKLHTILSKLNKNKEKPEKDNKIIISWNSLLVLAMIDYFEISSDDFYFNAALNLFGKLKQYFNGDSLPRIRYPDSLFDHSCLEDYSFFLEAVRKVFELTRDKNLLKLACQIMEAVNRHFINNNIVYFDKANSVFDTYDDAVYSAFGLFVKNLIFFKQYTEVAIDLDVLINISKDRFNKFPLAHPTLLNFL